MNLGFFASGSGSNFEAVAKRCRSGELAAEPAVVICNIPDAGVIERSQRLDVPCFLVRRDDFGGWAAAKPEIGIHRNYARIFDPACACLALNYVKFGVFQLYY